MKKFLAILMMVALLAAVVPAALAAEAVGNSSTTVYRVKTNGSRLYVHDEPNDKVYSRIGSLPNGTAFKKLKTSGSWIKIQTFTGIKGWVFKKWTAQNAYAKVTTKYQGLNVRKGPGTGYAIKGSIPKGTKKVTVKKISGNWAYVKYGCLEGWSSRTYLKWVTT